MRQDAIKQIVELMESSTDAQTKTIVLIAALRRIQDQDLFTLAQEAAELLDDDKAEHLCQDCNPTNGGMTIIGSKRMKAHLISHGWTEYQANEYFMDTDFEVEAL